jgi:hypothetical protein
MLSPGGNAWSAFMVYEACEQRLKECSGREAITFNTPYQGGVAVVSRTYPRLSVWHKTRCRLFPPKSGAFRGNLTVVLA